jgi:hypothetical protein
MKVFFALGGTIMKKEDLMVAGLALLAAVSVVANKANALETILENTNHVVVQPKISKQEMAIKKYTNAINLNDQELKELLEVVGFSGKGLKMAWAISKTESNGRPLAFNGNKQTGDASYGIFQINMLGNLGPDRREKFGLSSNAELFNPVKNAQIAFYMTSGGDDWSAWKDGQSERTKDFLLKYAAL